MISTLQSVTNSTRKVETGFWKETQGSGGRSALDREGLITKQDSPRDMSGILSLPIKVLICLPITVLNCLLPHPHYPRSSHQGAHLSPPSFQSCISEPRITSRRPIFTVGVPEHGRSSTPNGSGLFGPHLAMLQTVVLPFI
jgi:hypothetical protein